MNKNTFLITESFAKQFAQEWIESWNTHDIEKILEHYTDNFSIESLFAFKKFPETNGIVAGKNNVRKYWASALQSMPDLYFELSDILIGINNICLYYRNVTVDKQVAEVMFFNEDYKVYKTIAMYS